MRTRLLLLVVMIASFVVLRAQNRPTAALTGLVTSAEEGPMEGVLVSVKDDGCGFDAQAATEGTGITASIRRRIAEIDGRAEVHSAPGAGTEKQDPFLASPTYCNFDYEPAGSVALDGAGSSPESESKVADGGPRQQRRSGVGAIV